MGKPARLDRQAGRWALVNGIPFRMPVSCRNSPALFAMFSINAEKARKLIPGNEIHPLRLWNKGLLVVSVVGLGWMLTRPADAPIVPRAKHVIAIVFMIQTLLTAITRRNGTLYITCGT